MKIFLARELSINKCVELLMLTDTHDADNVAQNFIRKMSAEVMKTDGWKKLKQTRPKMAIETIF